MSNGKWKMKEKVAVEAENARAAILFGGHAFDSHGLLT
jgi:hypothetical protein